MKAIIDTAAILKAETDSLHYSATEDLKVLNAEFPRYLARIRTQAEKAGIEIEEDGSLDGGKCWTWEDGESDADLWDEIGVEGFWAWYNLSLIHI